MKLQEIDLGPFKRTKGDLYGMWFVYTPQGNFLVKGMFGLCEEYVKKNFSKYIARWTMWKNGKSRGYWQCSRGMGVRVLPEQDEYGMIDYSYSKRMKYKVVFDKSEETLEFRKIPKKWLPEYDRILAGNGFKVGETYTCELISGHDATTYFENLSEPGTVQTLGNSGNSGWVQTLVAGQWEFKVINSQDYPFLVRDGWKEKVGEITIQFGSEIVPCIPVNWFRNIRKV